MPATARCHARERRTVLLLLGAWFLFFAGARPATADAALGACANQGDGSNATHACSLTAWHARADVSVRSQQQPGPSRGSSIEYLLLTCDASGVLQCLPEDAHFQPIVTQACAADSPPNMLALLSEHRVPFIVSVGDASRFGFLKALPAQFRRTWFHVDDLEQLTTAAVESYYWHAIQLPIGGSPSEPLVSLFTPAYKSGRKIHIPYASLREQTYANWEWVIYDDSPPGHTDTWRELSALRAADARIHILRTDRNDGFIGSVKAKACAAASGQLLVELDHDDELTPDALELLKDALVANPDAGFFYSETVEMYEGTNETVDYGDLFAKGQGVHYRMLHNGLWVRGANSPPFTEATLRHIVGMPNHVRAWRREAYLAIGGHRRGLPVADDYELALRALFHYPAVYVRHMTYIQYRQLDQSTFTFTRNALIQRLVRITRAHHDSSINKLLLSHNLPDRGLDAIMYNFSRIQYDAAPTGPPLARSYHKPTATAPRDQPHVTVVIPTHNNTDGLLAALDSVYAQTYASWELLIVGDKCPQLEAFMEQQKQMFMDGNHTVRYHNLQREHPGSGFHAPLNAAVKGLVASDWVAYLRDDARWTPDHLGSLVAVLVEDPGRTFAFASLQVNNQVLVAEQPQLYRLDASAVIHHRSLIEKHGAWKSRAEVGYANDWELFSRWRDEAWGASLNPSVILRVSKAALQKLLDSVPSG